MYFYKENGKQCLDLKGTLILTHNDELVKTRIKSAAPSKIRNAQYITIKKLSFFGKIRATFHVIGFVWGRNQSLQRDTNHRESYRANVTNNERS